MPTPPPPPPPSRGCIRSDNSTCYLSEREVANRICYVTESQYTDTRPTSPRIGPLTTAQSECISCLLASWQLLNASVNFVLLLSQLPLNASVNFVLPLTVSATAQSTATAQCLSKFCATSNCLSYRSMPQLIFCYL